MLEMHGCCACLWLPLIGCKERPEHCIWAKLTLRRQHHAGASRVIISGGRGAPCISMPFCGPHTPSTNPRSPPTCTCILHLLTTAHRHLQSPTRPPHALQVANRAIEIAQELAKEKTEGQHSLRRAEGGGGGGGGQAGEGQGQAQGQSDHVVEEAIASTGRTTAAVGDDSDVPGAASEAAADAAASGGSSTPQQLLHQGEAEGSGAAQGGEAGAAAAAAAVRRRSTLQAAVLESIDGFVSRFPALRPAGVAGGGGAAPQAA